MDWIKRNTTVLVGALVALGLLGAAGYYLYSQIQRDQEISQRLEQRRSEWERLVRKDPYPNEANIKAARQDAERVNSFLGEIRDRFGAPSGLQVTNRSQFKSFLDTTVAELRHKAERYGVALPRQRYHFTFEPQSRMVNFKTNNIPTLASQLADIEAICDALFEPRIHELVGIRRVPVSDEDSGINQFINRSIETNQVAVVAPYEVTFKGFNAEFANVMQGLTNARECFLVKTVKVDPTTLREEAQGPSQQEIRRRLQQSRRTQQEEESDRSAQEEFQRRYGVTPGGGSSARDRRMRDSYGRSPGGGAASRQRQIQEAYQRERERRQSETSRRSEYGSRYQQGQQQQQGDMSDLEARPLEVRLLIQVVKLKPQEEQ